MPQTISLLGLNISLYYSFWLLGVVAVLILGYALGKHLGLSFAKSMLYVAGAVILGYLLLRGTSMIFNGGKVKGLNFIRIVAFMPISAYLLSRIFSGKFRTVLDYIAPLLAIFHGVTHLGCIFEGCCQGYPSDWGLYSNSVETVCFPIQPIEAVSSILIGVVLSVMIIRKKQRGKLYAYYLISYGVTRFLWEFLRDNEKIWWNISELALHALIAALLGVVFLVVFSLTSEKQQETETQEKPQSDVLAYCAIAVVTLLFASFLVSGANQVATMIAAIIIVVVIVASAILGLYKRWKHGKENAHKE